MRKPHAYRTQTVDVTSILGSQIASARRRRHMTVKELCERAQISPVTLRNVERGSPDVAIGIYFEAATILGVVLYAPDEGSLHDVALRQLDQLRLLPARIREPQELPDVF